MKMDLEEAEATYAKAEKQIAKWSPYARESSFARQQVELWTETLRANSWCLPGASGHGVRG